MISGSVVAIIVVFVMVWMLIVSGKEQPAPSVIVMPSPPDKSTSGLTLEILALLVLGLLYVLGRLPMSN